MILLSEALSLIANNSKSFANESKSITNTLKFTLFRTFKTLLWVSWYKNIDLTRRDISNKLMIFESDRKNGEIPLFGGKRSCLKYTF